MNDQAQKLRQMINKKSKKNANIRILTVTSGKGGVGKTNFTINLALSLCKLGYKVVVLDADIGFANINILLGIAPKYTLLDILYKDKNIIDIIEEGPYGLKLIAGGSGLNDIMNLNSKELEVLTDEFLELENIADFIIVDTGAGASEISMNFIRSSDEIILITTPEPTSITDAYSMLKVINKYAENKEINVIINRVKKEEEYTESFYKLNSVSKKFLDLNIKNLGFLYESKLLINSVIKQEPFTISYPKSDISKKINTIALKLLHSNYTINNTNGIKGFLNNIKKIIKRGGY